MPQSTVMRSCVPALAIDSTASTIEAIALVDAVRDVVIDVCAEEREDLPEDCDACDAIDVVVAVECDFLFLCDGLFEFFVRHHERPEAVRG